MLKILHVIHSIDPGSGGPSHAIRELTQAQQLLGHQVEILTTNAQAGMEWQDDDCYREQILTEPIFQQVPLQFLTSWGRQRPWSRYSFSPQAGQVLRNRFQSSDSPDVVHIHGVFSHISRTAAQLAAKARIPFIIRPAGALDTGCLQRGHAVLKKAWISVYLRRMLRDCAFVHVTSEQERMPIQDQYPDVRIEVVPHGTEVVEATGGQFREVLPIPEGSPFVLCLSRLHPIKRLDLAVDAFAAVQDEFADLHLVIAGNDAGALTDLRQLVAARRLEERCVFSGFVAGTNKAAAYTEARLLLHPSDHENFGLSVVEAMAYGCPVVTTPGVASGTLVECAQAGLVVPSDAKEIAVAMRELLSQSRDLAGARGAEYVRQNLTWPGIAERLSVLYESAMVSNSG